MLCKNNSSRVDLPTSYFEKSNSKILAFKWAKACFECQGMSTFRLLCTVETTFGRIVNGLLLETSERTID